MCVLAGQINCEPNDVVITCEMMGKLLVGVETHYEQVCARSRGWGGMLIVRSAKDPPPRYASSTLLAISTPSVGIRPLEMCVDDIKGYYGVWGEP